MAKFKIGDVVRFKSGGPAMTIASEVENGRIECWWFNHSENGYAPKWDSFKPELLEIAKPDMAEPPTPAREDAIP
jgi:uncharacterized protein YodC (DUF2158 family)